MQLASYVIIIFVDVIMIVLFRRRDWEEDYDPDWKKNYVEEERPVGPDGLPAWTVITPEVCGFI